MFIRSAHLFEGLRLEHEVVLAPFTVRPVSLDRGYFGREARAALNAELADIGAVTVVDAPSWGVQFGPYHRMAFAVSTEFEFADMRGTLSLNAAAAQLAGPLALAYGGAPRLLASITEARDSREDQWRTAAITAGGGDPQTGALLQVQTDRHPVGEIAPEAIWARASKDRRLTFWLTLFRDVLAEPRWDVRVFRVCSLLETIGKEILPSSAAVEDPAGSELLLAPGTPATTSSLRGGIYEVVRQSADVLAVPIEVLRTHPDADMWDEIRVWADLRNIVAHHGGWAGEPPGARRERVNQAFEVAGLGGRAMGRQRYGRQATAAADLVLRAVTAGAFDGHHQQDPSSPA